MTDNWSLDIQVMVAALLDSEMEALLAGEDVKTTRKYGDRAVDMLKSLNEAGWVVVPADQVKEVDSGA